MLKYRYHIAIVSLILSVFLWVSLNLNQTYEINKSIPVKINVSQPYSVSGNIPLNLEVKFRGVGWSLIRLFTSSNPEFNFSVIPKYNEQTVILTKQYLNENLGLAQNLTITDVYPESLYVMVDKYEEKYVKLVPRLNIVCRSGYQVVGNPVLEPDSVKIGGSPRLLNSLRQLSTKELSLSNISGNVSRIVDITDSLSNILWKSDNQIKLSVSVELTAEKEFQQVTIKIGGIPADKDVQLIPENVTVQLKGGVNQLSSLDASKIVSVLSYNEILSDTTGSVVPKFSLPPGMNLIKMKPDRIQYIIKKKF